MLAWGSIGVNSNWERLDLESPPPHVSYQAHADATDTTLTFDTLNSNSTTTSIIESLRSFEFLLPCAQHFQPSLIPHILLSEDAMLCAKCERVFTGECLRYLNIHAGSTQMDEYRHHDNVNALEISASEGCHLCVLMMDCLSRDEMDLLRPPSPATSELPLEQYKILFDIQRGDRQLFKLFFLHPPGLSLSSTGTGKPEHLPDKREPRYCFKTLELLQASKYLEYFPSIAEPGNSTNSEQTWSCLQKWLEECTQTHQSCTRQASAAEWKPTRLIDLSPAGAAPPPHLVEGDDILPGVVYATLSHCWGKAKVLRLLIENLSHMKGHILLHQLSKTFQDAIEVARKLKIRYLWIDSLCIIQDSSRDWELEASRMEHVYSNSFLNIAASHAEDGLGGLYRNRNPLLIQPCILRATWDQETPEDLVCTDPFHWAKRFESEALNTRAWVVQERVLSPRICHFSGTQLIWECNHTFTCESLLKGADLLDITKKRELREITSLTESSQPDLIWQCWRDVIKSYSRSSISFETDKLVAISGITRRMQSLLHTEYLAGLWREGLEYQLLWKAIQSNSLSSKRASTFVAPTWSWASLNNVEIYLRAPTDFKSEHLLLCRIIDVQVNPAQSTITCHGGYLVLRCYLIPIIPSFVDEKKLIVPMHGHDAPAQYEEVVCLTSLDTTIVETDEMDFWCAPILHIRGAVVSLNGILLYSYKHEKGVFRRCGTFSIVKSHKAPEDRIWKSGLQYGERAISTGDANVSLFDQILKYQIGSEGKEYSLCDGVPQFQITIK